MTSEKNLRLYEIAEKLDAISKEMKSNFPNLVGAMVLSHYANKIEELAREIERLSI